MAAPITEFVGVYDADSTMWGEASYWIGARLGRRHCALCDITHGLFTRRKDWQQCVSELPVPFTTFHRNDAPHDVLLSAGDMFPIVLARRGDQLEIAVTRSELETFNSSASQFAEYLIALLHTAT
jgi:hypothetical protein